MRSAAARRHVVLFGGDNIVALIDPGRKLKVEPNGLPL